MMSFDATIRADVPWGGGSGKYHDKGRRVRESSLHYGGWTLVDCGDGWRWAVKDGTNTRVRVCRQHEMQQRDVMGRYHKVVDEMEGE